MTPNDPFAQSLAFNHIHFLLNEGKIKLMKELVPIFNMSTSPNSLSLAIRLTLFGTCNSINPYTSPPFNLIIKFSGWYTEKEVATINIQLTIKGSINKISNEGSVHESYQYSFKLVPNLKNKQIRIQFSMINIFLFTTYVKQMYKKGVFGHHAIR